MACIKADADDTTWHNVPRASVSQQVQTKYRFKVNATYQDYSCHTQEHRMLRSSIQHSCGENGLF